MLGRRGCQKKRGRRYTRQVNNPSSLLLCERTRALTTRITKHCFVVHQNQNGSNNTIGTHLHHPGDGGGIHPALRSRNINTGISCRLAALISYTPRFHPLPTNRQRPLQQRRRTPIHHALLLLVPAISTHKPSTLKTQTTGVFLLSHDPKGYSVIMPQQHHTPDNTHFKVSSGSWRIHVPLQIRDDFDDRETSSLSFVVVSSFSGKGREGKDENADPSAQNHKNLPNR